MSDQTQTDYNIYMALYETTGEGELREVTRKHIAIRVGESLSAIEPVKHAIDVRSPVTFEPSMRDLTISHLGFLDVANDPRGVPFGPLMKIVDGGLITLAPGAL